MILKNARSYIDGSVVEVALLIKNGLIEKVIRAPSESKIKSLQKINEDNAEIDCQKRYILPGIVDVHAHLRDLEQSEKETFSTGTKAAAVAGITTVFNMPNTKPPAISASVVKKWMEAARGKIFTNVGFIAGVPQDLNEDEFKEILQLGVYGFKVYPLSPLEGLDWTNQENINRLLSLASKYNSIVFFHPDWPLSEQDKAQIQKDGLERNLGALKIHDNLFPEKQESKYVKFVLENYTHTISKQKLKPTFYPRVHFCHISSVESYGLIKEVQSSNKDFKITFEVTPHHLLLSNSLALKHKSFAKVLPPLRDEPHPKFLFEELKKGNIKILGTDHAPHTAEEKAKDFFSAPSGFPGFETYSLLLLDKVFRDELSLQTFVKVTSENPAKMLNLNTKGSIKEKMDADLLIAESTSEYSINSTKFKTKAKFSPYEGFLTEARVWKVFLKGLEIKPEENQPRGEILKKSY